MDRKQLQAFVTLGRELHFGRTADQLNLTGPALGRLIRALEADVGTSLLTRTTRRVDLTSAGRAFLPEAHAILERMHSAAHLARRTASGHAGRLRLGYLGAANLHLLPRLWRHMSATHPDIHIEATELCTPDQRQALLAGELDAGLMALPVWHDRLIAQPLTRIPLLAALPAAHPLAGSARLHLRELADEEWLTCTPHHTTPPPEQVQALYQTFGQQPRIRAVGGTEGAVVGRVAAGQGVTLVPQTLVNPQQEGVAFIPLEGGVTLDVGLVTCRDAANPALGALLGSLAVVTGHAGPGSGGGPRGNAG
ncbi:LysR family transcriptional regulator [Deinococcus depolymerans]|uniref:LysR family transcriptional regulator n=1 Tax=Deinococcus depolymerans TaxID=392408 RepID=A0ABP3LIZ4_9DEIO